MKARRSILVAFIICGLFALLAAGLFILAGAGSYGSPFQGDSYFNLTLSLVLIFGPMAVLPCSILECFKTGFGGLLLCGFAIADVIAISLNNTREWGFAMHDAALWSACLAFPAFVVGTILLYSSDRIDGRLKAIWKVEFSLAIALTVFFLWHTGRDGLTTAFWWLSGGTI